MSIFLLLISFVNKEQTAVSKGWWFGLLGICGFSFTLPVTRLIVTFIDPLIIALGRGVLAAIPGAVLLWLTKQAWPSKKDFLELFVVALGIVIGFPILTSLAMRQLPASHGAVITGLTPLLTLCFATWLAGERASKIFWLTSIAGSATVFLYAFSTGGGHIRLADLLLLGAIIFVALGYAVGGRLAQRLGGWQVTCWALVVAFPFLIVPFIGAVAQHGIHAPVTAWLGFAYVTFVSQFLAFFAFYRGMSLAGIARVGQIQLFQPFLTASIGIIFLHEPLTIQMILAAIIILILISMGRRTRLAVLPIEKQIL